MVSTKRFVILSVLLFTFATIGAGPSPPGAVVGRLVAVLLGSYGLLAISSARDESDESDETADPDAGV